MGVLNGVCELKKWNQNAISVVISQIKNRDN